MFISPLIISLTSGTMRSNMGEEVVVEDLLSIYFAANYFSPVKTVENIRVFLFVLNE
jgi:hypothetical protein